MKLSWKNWTFLGVSYLMLFICCINLVSSPLAAWCFSIHACVSVCSLRHLLCGYVDIATSGPTISASIFNLSICSVARKPALELWTARTKVCDMLHDPVSLKILNNINSTFPFWLCAWLSCPLQVRIAMVGKYTGLSDSYLSVLKVNVLFIENIVYPSVAFFYPLLFKDKNYVEKLRVVVVQIGCIIPSLLIIV